MTVESPVNYIDDLDNTYPASGDTRTEGDDHIRNIKTALLASFPNITGAVSATQVELNILDGYTGTTAELNYLDQTAAGTITADEAVVADGSGNIDCNNSNFTNVDIDSGAIDGVTIGANSAPTVTNLGSVATCDINGGTLDDVTIGAATAATVTGAALGTAVTAVTQSQGDNSTAIATTEYTDAAVAGSPFTEYNETTAATITSGNNTYSVAHTLTGIPTLFKVFIRCTAGPDAGYSTNDEIDVSSNPIANDFSIWADGTNVGISANDTFSNILDFFADKTGGGGTLTTGDWKWVIRAWK